jgi:hypothetical protein
MAIRSQKERTSSHRRPIHRQGGHLHAGRGGGKPSDGPAALRGHGRLLRHRRRDESPPGDEAVQAKNWADRGVGRQDRYPFQGGQEDHRLQHGGIRGGCRLYSRRSDRNEGRLTAGCGPGHGLSPLSHDWGALLSPGDRFRFMRNPHRGGQS